MNNLLVICKIKPLERNSFKNVEFIASNHEISLKIKDDNLFLRIQGLNKKSKNISISTLFSAVFDLIYLCLGKFPEIISYTENGQTSKDCELLKKYISSPFFGRTYFAIRCIDSDVINEQTLINIIRLNETNYSLCSLEYLTSKTYDEIMWEHKLTLILHAFDGVCNYLNLNVEDLKKDFSLKYESNSQNCVGGYIAFVEYAFDKYFFNYDVSDAILLALKRKSKFAFLQGIEQFRNFYSHLLNKTELSSRLNNQPQSIMLSYVFAVIIRCMILVECLNVDFDTSKVEKAYLTICDAINIDILKRKSYKPLSSTYQFYDFMEKIRNQST